MCFHGETPGFFADSTVSLLWSQCMPGAQFVTLVTLHAFSLALLVSLTIHHCYDTRSHAIFNVVLHNTGDQLPINDVITDSVRNGESMNKGGSAKRSKFTNLMPAAHFSYSCKS